MNALELVPIVALGLCLSIALAEGATRLLVRVGVAESRQAFRAKARFVVRLLGASLIVAIAVIAATHR